jgi:hypothetical protein
MFKGIMAFILAGAVSCGSVFAWQVEDTDYPKWGDAVKAAINRPNLALQAFALEALGRQAIEDKGAALDKQTIELLRLHKQGVIEDVDVARYKLWSKTRKELIIMLAQIQQTIDALIQLDKQKEDTGVKSDVLGEKTPNM